MAFFDWLERRTWRGRERLHVGRSSPKRNRREAVLEAPGNFLGGIRDIHQRLVLLVEDAPNLHCLEENALGLFENDFAVLRLINAGDHFRGDVACLTARNGAFGRVGELQRRADARNVAGDAGDVRVNKCVELDVLESENAERNVGNAAIRAAGNGCGEKERGEHSGESMNRTDGGDGSGHAADLLADESRNRKSLAFCLRAAVFAS